MPLFDGLLRIQQLTARAERKLQQINQPVFIEDLFLLPRILRGEVYPRGEFEIAHELAAKKIPSSA